MPRYRNEYETAKANGRLWTPRAETVFRPLRWFDIDDRPTLDISSGLCSVWGDKSIASPSNATQGTSGNRPTYSVKGFPGGVMPALIFDGSTSFMDFTNAGWDDTIGRSLICAVGVDTNASVRTILSGDYSDMQFRLQGSHKVHITRTYVADLGTGATTLATGGHVLGLDSTGSAWELFANGASDATGGSPGFDGSVFRIGSNGNALGEWFSGAMGELIVTNKLPRYERYKYDGYAAWKWGTVDKLSPANPFKNRPPLIGD